MDLIWDLIKEYLPQLLSLLVALVPVVGVWMVRISKKTDELAVLLKEMQEFSAVVSAALADKKIDNEEIARILDEGDDIVPALKKLLGL